MIELNIVVLVFIGVYFVFGCLCCVEQDVCVVEFGLCLSGLCLQVLYVGDLYVEVLCGYFGMGLECLFVLEQLVGVDVLFVLVEYLCDFCV